MTLHVPDLNPALSYPFQSVRQMMRALVPQAGINYAGDYNPASATGMNITVGGGDAWINGQAVSGQGMYHVYNDAQVTVGPFTAADATNPRVDQVYLVVNDSSISGVSDSAQLVIIT